MLDVIAIARRLPRDVGQAVLALLAIALGAWQRHAGARGVATEATTVDGTPVTVFRAADGAPAPVVVIAHGFEGSQQLMQSFALALARGGYVAVAGHERNPTPLAGSITEVEGVTRRRPGVAGLSWLHRHHHDPRAMAARDFNITWPIGDRLFGTLERPRD